jgi:hypothetical protein
VGRTFAEKRLEMAVTSIVSSWLTAGSQKGARVSGLTGLFSDGGDAAERDEKNFPSTPDICG